MIMSFTTVLVIFILQTKNLNTNSVGIMYKVLLYIIWGIYILNNMYELSVHFISERFLYQFVYDFYLNIHILCGK